MSTTLWASEGEEEEEEEERRRRRGGEEKVEGWKGRHERDSLYNSVKLSIFTSAHSDQSL